MNRFAHAIISLAIFVAPAVTQDMPTRKTPSVVLEPYVVTSIPRGTATPVELQFRVAGGFHINSNKPTAEYLIPTTLKLDAPTDLVVGKITYPPGEEASFAFAPNEKLSVYAGEFTVNVQVRPLSTVLPGKYEFHGILRYQACDNAQCYPPKNTPVQFEVKVVKTPPPHHANPAQSPHVHS